MRFSSPARFTAALLAFFPAFVSPASAQGEELPQTSGEPVSIRPDLDVLTKSWGAVHGASWRYFADPATGHLEMLAGGNIEPAFTPADDSDAEWAELALSYIALVEPMFGVEPATLSFDRALLLPFGQYGSTDKMTVRFLQVVDGVPVVQGSINVLMDMAGRLLSVQSIAAPRIFGTSTAPRTSADFAASVAVADFEASVRLVPTAVGRPELVFYQHVEHGLRQPYLAWQIDVRAEIADSEPEAVRYWIDAHAGTVLASESQVHNFDVGGTVRTLATPGLGPDVASNPEQPFLGKRLRVTSSAGTVFTNDAGVFNYPGVTGPLSCTFTYVGTFADVFNEAGGEYSLVQSLSGTGNVVTMNPTPTDQQTAQANAFVQVNALRDWIRSVIPGDDTADFQVTANCNINDTCNAYFDGGSINFFLSGGGCPNTAYSTIVVHEEGHWLNVEYGTGNNSSGIGEGNADHFATYMFDTPIMGQDFCGTGCFVRTGENTRQFCGDCCVGCHGGVHNNGEVWMGATWKVRTRLKNAHGVGPGGAIANLIFLGWMNAYDQTTITSIMETQWLTLDDNDGSIGNGTPNYAHIDGGYRQQGFPGVDLDAVVITNVTDLPDTQSEVGPYQVDATVDAQLNPPLQSANLRWRSNGGAFSTIPLTPIGGDDFTTFIPNVPSPAHIEYYIEGTDSLNITETFPAGAPGNTLEFEVGIEATFFFNDFEGGTNEGWGAGGAGDDATTGIWVRADPNPTDAQPGDDHTNPGVQCWFTGQGTAGGAVGENDVDGGQTTLLSPVFNASGLVDAEISYWRWYSNDEGSSPNNDVFVVGVSNNGGSSWTTVETVGPGGSQASGGWFQHTFDILDFVAPTATMRLRFIASDEGQGSIIEAAIDDITGIALGPGGGGPDCNNNGVPDSTDISNGTSQDCNANLVPDECDTENGSSLDCNVDGVPDECQIDCNSNGIPDDCDLGSGSSEDCNSNSIPDECDINGGASIDANGNGVPDECECGGATYCVTAPNSVGSGALISFSGSTSLFLDNLVLEADNAPSGQNGIFYYGPNQVQLPFGDGFRCVGGGVFRFPIIVTNGAGHAQFAVDYGNLPSGGGISAGDTFNFQFWYRDPSGPGGSGFNLSNGLSLMFCD